VRWIETKEHHANLIQEIVEQYFMTQRIKPADPDNEVEFNKYISQITILHKMLIYAMKTKQGLDIENVFLLQRSTEEFELVYFGPEELEHMHEHEH
jgi:nickel superoxide dismutase